MPKWRKKDIIMVSIAFTITLILMFIIGFMGFSETTTFILMSITMVASFVTIIIINEKRLKKEEGK
ncbi:MAG: hypothetical protein RLZZ546_2633 [Bacteroidota bacterium]|jgi:hypothetical protein